MIKRLKYVSHQSYSMTRSEIDEVVNLASVNNAKVGISGALVATGNVFFQIIEGPTEAIDKLFAAITADKRHRDVICLEVQTERAERLFPGWSMKRVALEGGPRAAAIEDVLRRLVSAEPSERQSLSEELSRMMSIELRAAA